MSSELVGPSEGSLRNNANVISTSGALQETQRSSLDTPLHNRYDLSKDHVLAYMKHISKVGFRDWQEIVPLMRGYPHYFDSIYLDIDETLITTNVYQGSQQWFDEHSKHFDEGGWRRNIVKSDIERGLLSRGLLRLTDPELPETLRQMKAANPCLRIKGITSRPTILRQTTNEILETVGLGDLEVIFQTNGPRKIKAIHDDMKGRSNANDTLSNRGISIFVDDQPQSFQRSLYLQSLDKMGVLILEHKGASQFDLDTSYDCFHRSLKGAGDTDVIGAPTTADYFCDVMLLSRLSTDPNHRLEIYLNPAVVEQVHTCNDHVKMAYIEAVSDFFARKFEQDVSSAGREALLDQFYTLITYDKDLWKAAHEMDKLCFQKVDRSKNFLKGRGNYEILITPSNAYLFLEPLLDYLKSQRPDLLILPDSATRPLTEALQYFIESEDLSTRIINFPISTGDARDTEYEIARWIRLSRGELTIADQEDEKVACFLRETAFEDIKGGSRAVVFDDNLVHGKTGRTIINVMARCYGVDVEAVFTPFDYQSSVEDRGFPSVATIKTFGKFGLRDTWAHRAPSVIVRMQWEDDPMFKGLGNRKRFTTPPAKSLGQGRGAEVKLAFQSDYQRWFHRAERIPCPLIERSRAQGFQQELKINDKLSPHLPIVIQNEGAPFSLRRETSKLPSWVKEDGALRQNDLQLLHRENVFFYSLVHDNEELGYVVLSILKNSQGEDSLLVEKIQPRMKFDHQIMPEDVFTLLNIYLSRENDSLHCMYAEANINSAGNISDSHRVRRAFDRSYFDGMPVDSTFFHHGNAAHFNGKIGGDICLLWKRMSVEESELFSKAQSLLTEIIAQRPLGPSFVNLTFNSDIEAYGVRLARNLPVTRTDVMVLSEIKKALESPKDAYLFTDKSEADDAWFRLRGNIEVQKYVQLGEVPNFRRLYVNLRRLPTKEERINHILRYFLTEVWDRGYDLANTRYADIQSEFAKWGMEELLKLVSGGATLKMTKGPSRVTGGSKEGFLNTLAPGEYTRRGKYFTVANNSGISKQNFERFLRGEWYAAPLGATYKIQGDERVPPHWQESADFFLSRKEHVFRFESSEEFGVFGVESTAGHASSGILYHKNHRVHYATREAPQCMSEDPPTQTKQSVSTTPPLVEVKIRLLAVAQELIGEDYTARILPQISALVDRHPDLSNSPEKVIEDITMIIDRASYKTRFIDIKRFFETIEFPLVHKDLHKEP